MRGETGADRGLCRRGLFPALQPDPAGHIGSRGDRLRRHRDARRAQRGQPRLCGDDPQRLADRVHLPAAVQPDRRLRQLCRAGRLRPHPATDAAARASRRSAGRLTRSAAAQTAGFDPGARAVFGQALAHLCFALPGLALYLIVLPRVYGFSTLGRLEDLILMAVPFVLSVSFLAQFVERLVSPPRDRDSPLHRRQPAALLPGRRVLAGRSPSRFHPRGEPHLPQHLGHRRIRSHQPDGREHPRGEARLDDAYGFSPSSTGCSLCLRPVSLPAMRRAHER